MSHEFLENGRCKWCSNMSDNMIRGDNGKLPSCPDAQPSGKYSQIYIYIYIYISFLYNLLICVVYLFLYHISIVFFSFFDILFCDLLM